MITPLVTRTRGRTHKVGRANVGTGEHANAWAEELQELIGQAGGVEVRFPPAMPEYVQQLMASLGARIVFDKRIPVPAAWTRGRTADAQ